MATQEERLVAVERFAEDQTETNKAMVEALSSINSHLSTQGEILEGIHESVRAIADKVGA